MGYSMDQKLAKHQQKLDVPTRFAAISKLVEILKNECLSGFWCSEPFGGGISKECGGSIVDGKR